MPSPQTNPSTSLSKETWMKIFRTMVQSRMGDLREQSLLRQGQGWFHVGGHGHEAVAALAVHLEKGDFVVPYYRDRALVLARGLTNHDIALSFYAKRQSSSGGRQLPGHYSARRLNIWSHPSPIGSHLLPACGIAWGLKLDRKPNVVLATTGEAASRQGDFFEAACIAIEKKLPVIFVVEDNGIAISTPNRETNALALGVLDNSRWIRANGRSLEEVHRAGAEAVRIAREEGGPAFVWLELERTTSHSSADDHRLYRSEEELRKVDSGDPLILAREFAIREGWLDQEGYEKMEAEIREEVRRQYSRARDAEDPSPTETTLHLRNDPPPSEEKPDVPLSPKTRLLDAVNQTFHAIFRKDRNTVFYGQDIADPKGGVFRLTAGLSTEDPERAENAPVAESTILGLACGLASYGKKPFFEIQFIDFISPGWNQLANNLATLRWRSFGEWSCPAVIYAPYGAYLPGGAIWHSSSSEGLFANLPGLSIVVPSTPEDAAGLLWAARDARDPVLVLIPKHLMWAEVETPQDVPAVPIGSARLRREGKDLTIVAWGNCLEVVEKALEPLGSGTDVELIDLRTIVPWDREAVLRSVRKTGRLLVVQEDTEPCSIGQAIVAEVNRHPEAWATLKAPPEVISRDEAPVGFNPIYEYASLPSADHVGTAIRRLVAADAPARSPMMQAPASEAPVPAQPEAQPEVEGDAISVPILGEGITTARILNFFKKAGETFDRDESVCEVETDKAVFPIETSERGRIVKWLVAEGDDVAVGQRIANIELEQKPRPRTSGRNGAPSTEAQLAAFREYESENGEIAGTSGLTAEVIQQMQGIVPATIMMKARWDAIREARRRAKNRYGRGESPTPSAMIAWALVQAMCEHPSFTHTLLMGKMPRPIGDFDLGVAVSLPGDKLATAIVPDVNRRTWSEFLPAFHRAVRETREGKFQPKTRIPVLLSTMGQYDVLSAAPIVVPPSIATLFVGSAHVDFHPDKEDFKPAEVARLVLTFDHRWINGAGSASFLRNVKRRIENFTLPDLPEGE